MVHFRQAAVEQPPARYARRPPGSARIFFQIRLCKIPISIRRPSGRHLPAIRNPQSAIRLPQLTHTIKLIITSVKSVTQGCDGSFSTGSGRTTPCSLRSPPPRLVGGPLTFRLVRAFQTRLCTAPYILAAAPAAAPSRTPHPAPRNLEADSGGAYRSEANSRIPQLTHTIKLIIASVKSVTQGCDGSFSTGSGRTTPCSLRSPPPRLVSGLFKPACVQPPYILAAAPAAAPSRITNHEPRNLGNVLIGARRGEANPRIPQLTHTVVSDKRLYFPAISILWSSATAAEGVSASLDCCTASRACPAISGMRVRRAVSMLSASSVERASRHWPFMIFLA